MSFLLHDYFETTRAYLSNIWKPRPRPFRRHRQELRRSCSFRRAKRPTPNGRSRPRLSPPAWRPVWMFKGSNVQTFKRQTLPIQKILARFVIVYKAGQGWSITITDKFEISNPNLTGRPAIQRFKRVKHTHESRKLLDEFASYSNIQHEHNRHTFEVSNILNAPAPSCRRIRAWRCTGHRASRRPKARSASIFSDTFSKRLRNRVSEEALSMTLQTCKEI